MSERRKIKSHPYPRARPNVGTELEDRQLEHEINARDELYNAANSIHGSPHQMQNVAGPSIGAKSQACKLKQKSSSLLFLVVSKEEKPAGISQIMEGRKLA